VPIVFYRGSLLGKDVLIHVYMFMHYLYYSPVAVAIFNYESFGDDEGDALEFEEGELIEV